MTFNGWSKAEATILATLDAVRASFRTRLAAVESGRWKHWRARCLKAAVEREGVAR